MAQHRHSASDDSAERQIPDRDTEEIRDETQADEEFEDTEDEGEEVDDTDLGKSVLDQERGAVASQSLTSEIGSEGGSDGKTEVEREPGRRRVNAGEATTIGGQPADELRFDRRREG